MKTMDRLRKDIESLEKLRDVAMEEKNALEDVATLTGSDSNAEEIVSEADF